ncbi:MAG: hypothetical protein OEV14_09995, partial [Gammaproteobacteria bacterium]|nr:hypothetical protein [Gammaproteobacteria bacterium]
MSEGETTPKVPEPQTGAKRGAKPASDTGEKVQATANRPPGSRGRLLAGFALLVALVAAGIGGYLYYLLVYRSPLAPVDARLSSMEETLALQGSE